MQREGKVPTGGRVTAGGGGEVTPPESPRMSNSRSRMPATHNSRAAARFSETPRMLTEIGHGKWVQDAVQWMWGGGEGEGTEPEPRKSPSYDVFE